jgi:thiamine biosynthesis protein ThiS
MQVIINGENKEVRENITLSDLISELQISAKRIAVEVNEKVVRRQDWEITQLKENDKIEIVHFVGGG